jgi:hypothetical protein
MSKVITFSRVFPKTHPRSGELTNFVEKIWKSQYVNGVCPKSLNSYINNYIAIFPDDILPYYDSVSKHHTIRSGNRWKAADKFSPRVWSGMPYRSKQIIIAPDIEIRQVFDIKIEGYSIWINKNLYSVASSSDRAIMLARNDGLNIEDFWNWFKKKVNPAFQGQIICWSNKISYHAE